MLEYACAWYRNAVMAIMSMHRDGSWDNRLERPDRRCPPDLSEQPHLCVVLSGQWSLALRRRVSAETKSPYCLPEWWMHSTVADVPWYQRAHVDRLMTVARVATSLARTPAGKNGSWGKRQSSLLRPCSHCQCCAGTVPICRISRVCERVMSAIKLDLISEN